MNLLALFLLAVATGTPLLLGVLGELVLQRSGIINIGLEGMMLCAAMSGAYCALISGSAAIGIVGGIAGALLAALLFGFLTIERRADQIVAGAAINFVAAGATSLAYSRGGDFWTHSAPRLAGLPVAGGAAIDPVMLLAWIVAPIVVFVLLWRTRVGLRMRAAGEYPEALRLNGGSVRRQRWIALLVETLFCGIAGAYLSLVLSSGFAENMVAGRGFIALAIVIFARWRPYGAVAGTLLFSVAIAAQYRLQAMSTGVQFHLLLALPYVLTLIALVVFMRSVRAPQSLGR